MVIMQGANRKHSLTHIFNVLLEQTIASYGRVPTRRKLADAVGIDSLSVLNYNLQLLHDQGKIVMEGGGRSCNIRIPGLKVVYEPVQQGG